jgi:uncharacterized protein
MRVGRTHLLFCALTLLLISVSPARADLEAGKRAFEQRDYTAAIKELKPLAEQGNAEAQALLGEMYGLGRGVPLDVNLAQKWYKAADQGNAHAQCSLGSMDLKRDTAQGLRLLKLSAEQGDADAYLILGMAYMNLKQAPPDVVQADMWLRLAAGRGDPLASGQRSKLESQMTREQVAKAEALAAAWKPKVTAGPGAEKKN